MNVPERWKLVPIEPTPLMLSEGIAAWEKGTIWLDGGPEVYAAMLQSAPTPPAPEVEPVGEIAFNGASVNIAFYDAATPLTIKQGTKLYTRPANDGLRKAAEEALRILDLLGSGPTADNLRAELDKDKS